MSLELPLRLVFDYLFTFEDDFLENTLENMLEIFDFFLGLTADTYGAINSTLLIFLLLTGVCAILLSLELSLKSYTMPLELEWCESKVELFFNLDPL